MRKLSSLVLASGLISAMTVAQAAVTVYPDYPAAIERDDAYGAAMGSDPIEGGFGGQTLVRTEWGQTPQKAHFTGLRTSKNRLPQSMFNTEAAALPKNERRNEDKAPTKRSVGVFASGCRQVSSSS